MEFRKIFDTIPELFDKHRQRYCPALFEFLIRTTGIGPGKSVLELGPGTGQATDPVLKTGCDYHAIELGENLYRKMLEKYAFLPNFSIVNADFITHDFESETFDLIYSAATIQWIDEEIAFPKTLSLLKPGGTLAMMFTKGDYRTPNEELFTEIQKVYKEHFRPETPYTRGGFRYDAAPEYGYASIEKHVFHSERILTAEQYALYSSTHCDHIAIPEPHKSALLQGLRDAVDRAGGTITFRDAHTLYLARKPA